MLSDKSIRLTLIGFLASFLLVSCSGTAGDTCVAFYNCENFFDPADNPAKDDDDFTPNGRYHYTRKLYEQKLHNIAAVIQNMTGGNSPSLLGMAEVENEIVLRDLVRQPEIARRHYNFVWYSGPDPRGINVALLYKSDDFKLISSEPLPVDISAVESSALTRDILHVYGVLKGDSVHLFVVHWPSRRGGEEDSEPKRLIAASVLNAAVGKVRQNEPQAKIILLGDFNDNPTDNTISGALGAKAAKNDVSPSGFYNPWADIYHNGGGTEVFKRQWNLFDQVIISGTLLNAGKLHYDHAEIFRPDFIVDHHKGHEGEPHRSFVGARWINGFSDHFPVILYLAK